ncbi:MAG: cation transporter [Candidatus Acidiferrum sp.]
MASITSASPPNLVGRVQRLQVLTIAWMTLEAAIALAAAWKARSPALFGFGGDSLIELLSGLVVLWRFRSQTETEAARAEKIAARIAGGLLFTVALFVATASSLALLGYYEPRTSLVGIALLVVAAFGMPWLASQKRNLAAKLSSASLRADAAESSLCGYLAWIALAGLVANALFGIWWADPVAALTLLPFVLKEGWHAIHASRPGCDCCSVEAAKDRVPANR